MSAFDALIAAMQTAIGRPAVNGPTWPGDDSRHTCERCEVAGIGRSCWCCGEGDRLISYAPYLVNGSGGNGADYPF